MTSSSLMPSSPPRPSRPSTAPTSWAAKSPLCPLAARPLLRPPSLRGGREVVPEVLLVQVPVPAAALLLLRLLPRLLLPQQPLLRLRWLLRRNRHHQRQRRPRPRQLQQGQQSLRPLLLLLVLRPLSPRPPPERQQRQRQLLPRLRPLPQSLRKPSPLLSRLSLPYLRLLVRPRRPLQPRSQLQLQFQLRRRPPNQRVRRPRSPCLGALLEAQVPSRRMSSTMLKWVADSKRARVFLFLL